MRLHEYQAKELFRKAGIPVPEGRMVTTPDEAVQAAQTLKGPPWVIKAQIHAGGRGKGGGVRIAREPGEVLDAARDILGKRLVTRQTGPEGVQVRRLLVEEGVDIAREFYLSMVIDRASGAPTMIFSAAGGMEIEEIAGESPEKILKERVEVTTGWMPYQGRNLLYAVTPALPPPVLGPFGAVMAKVSQQFAALDCSLLEINPLVTTGAGGVIALDAKLSIDDNAAFRRKDLFLLEDLNEKDPLEVEAQASNLNYIRLDGNVGAMVNGAGLAMATMDLIKMAGAEPANFLDVGGGATEEMITRGMEIILRDARVKAILINIFGGILRCDVLAKGVIAAAQKTGIGLPLIVRLEGTNVEEGRELLRNSGLTFLVAGDLSEAARLVARSVTQERQGT